MNPKPLKRLYCLLTVVCLFIAVKCLCIEPVGLDATAKEIQTENIQAGIGVSAAILSFMFAVLFAMQSNKLNK